MGKLRNEARRIKNRVEERVENLSKKIKLLTGFIFAYLIVFCLIAIYIGNTEFIFYNLLLFVAFGFIYYYHKELQLTFPTFLALSILGFVHAAGGVIYWGETKLYDMYFWIIRYDNLVHFYGSFVVVFLAYNLIKPYLIKKPIPRPYLALLLVKFTLGAGAVNEILEFTGVKFLNATGVGDYINNARDNVFNLVGALTGSLAVLYYYTEEVIKKRGL